MNCCKTDKKKNALLIDSSQDQLNSPDNIKESKRSLMGFLLHMVVCCGLPAALLILLPLIGYKGLLLDIAPLICPIMMFVMMFMMMRGHGHSCYKDKK